MTPEQLNEIAASPNADILSMHWDVMAEELIAQRGHLATQAEQCRVMREALEALTDACISGTTEEGYPELVIHHEPFIAAKKVLALTPTAAEQQAKENAEKAALLNWWFIEANEWKREAIRQLRETHIRPWTAEQWIARVRAAKEATDENL